MELKTERHQVLRAKLFGIQVCSMDSEADALAWVQNASPAGTSHNWQKSEDPDHRPIKCANDTSRTHYVFIC